MAARTARRDSRRPRQDELAYDILRSIRRILRRVSEHSRTLSRVAGLTVPQLLCLRAVAEGGDAGGVGRVTGADVSRRLQLSAPTVSRILDRLERAGLLARERDAVDRRRVFLAVTAPGRDVLSRSPTPLQDEFLDRLRALPETERARLLESLRRIVELMEASDVDAAPLIAPGDQLRPAPETSRRRARRQ